MINADAHEAIVRSDVVDAVRNRLADGLVREVVNIDELGFAGRLPFAAAGLEVANQLLFFVSTEITGAPLSMQDSESRMG